LWFRNDRIDYHPRFSPVVIPVLFTILCRNVIIMPLKALVNGEEVLSWNFTREEWKHLDEAKKLGECEITMECCGAPAILKAGTRIQHFAHRNLPDYCDWKPVSPEHRLAAFLIARACIEAGWDAKEESGGAGFRADVLASKDEIKIAFEVQLKYQTLEETLRRRGLITANDVVDYWLFKKLPATKGFKTKFKRFYQLVQEDEDFVIQQGNRRTRLQTFVKRVLTNMEIDEHESDEFDTDEFVYSHTPDIDDPLGAFIKAALRFGLYVLLVWLLILLFFRNRK